MKKNDVLKVPLRWNKKLKTLIIMKLLLFNCMILVSISANVLPQGTFSLNISNKTFRETLKEIEERSELHFFYNEEFIDLDKIIDLKVTDVNEHELLEQLFKEQMLTYQLLDVNLVVITPSGLKQEITIRGNVTDIAGSPLPGVNVVEKGTTNGAVTDLEGGYSISVSPQNSILSFSFIGYLTEEIEVNDKTTINVTMVEDIKALDEVVVVGYGVQKKSSVTGAISSVKSEDLENRTITRAEQALQGKTAGVQLVSVSNQPGSTPSIRVRGFSSNSTSDPLYVVDGLRVPDIGGIDPNNIQSMEVLKDAASAAIYGAEAGNGVVLITTKSGTKGTSSINFSSQYSLVNISRIPDMIDSDQYIQMSREADASFNEASVQELITTGVWDGVSTTDWFDVAFETSVMKRNALSFQGANDRGSYYLSTSFLDDNGIVRGNKDVYNRLSAMINADYKVKPWFKIGTTNNIEKYTRKAITDGGSNNVENAYLSMVARVMNLAPIYADVYDADDLPITMQNLLASGWTLLQNEDGQYYSTLGSGEEVHPVVMRDATDSKQYGYNLLGTVYADFTPLKGLVFTSKLGYRLSDGNSYSYSHDYYGATSVGNQSNSVTRWNNTSIYYQWENFMNYNLNLNNHNFTALLGTAYSETDRTYLSSGVSQVLKDDPLFADIETPAADATRTVGGYNRQYRNISYFGRLSYDFGEKYFLEGSVRADAADLAVFPDNNRWGYFPAVSGGWVISKENFFPQSTPISFIKLRASWGQNGSTSSLRLNPYQYSSSISNESSGYSFATSAIYSIASFPSQLSNPDLKWETSEQLDFGIDIRALEDRLTMSLDWFDKKTIDLIVTGSAVPFEAGNTSPPLNAGDVLNRGVELELGWKARVDDFTYSVNGNLATLNNEVTFLDPNISDGRIYGAANLHTSGSLSAFEVGHPVWYFYGYQVDYIDATTGDPVFVDVDESGSITAEDKTQIGKPMPDFTYGFTLNMAWKGIDFLAFGSGAYGNDVFSALQYGTVTYNLEEVYNKRWTSTNTDAEFARPGCNDGDLYRVSDAFVFDASYFKIKQIQLGYSLPETMLNKVFVDNMRIYISLDDAFVFTKYPGLDPEVASNAVSGMGIDYGNYPSTRKTVFGVSVTF